MSIQYKITLVMISAIPSCKQKIMGLMFSVDVLLLSIRKIGNYHKPVYLSLLPRSKKNIATK